MQKLHVAAVDPATGQSRASASVRVYVGLTFNLATLYADDEVTPLPNPLTADTAGRAAFKVPDGEYDIEVSGQGFLPYKITLVQAADKDGFATKADLAKITQGTVTQGSLTYVDAKLEYGAKGDGVTDDRASIQAAINSRRGPVYLRPGTYLISGALVLLDSTRLLGAGTHLTTVKPSGTGFPALFADGTTYLSVEDMTIQSPVVSGSGANGIHCRLSHEIFMARVQVNGHFKAGVYLDQCSQAQMITIFSQGCDNGYQFLASTVVNMYNCTAYQCNDVGVLLASACSYFTAITLNVQEFQDAGVYVAGNLDSAVFMNCIFGNSTPRGVWFLADTPISRCWFLGISIGNTGNLQVPATSDYWAMLSTAMKTNTGEVWATTSIRAWGHLSTTGFVGNTLGVLSVVRQDVGRCRVFFKPPAVFESNSYSVQVTPTNASGNPVSAGIVVNSDAYFDVSFLAGANNYQDITFFMMAGGKVVV